MLSFHQSFRNSPLSNLNVEMNFCFEKKKKKKEKEKKITRKWVW